MIQLARRASLSSRLAARLGPDGLRRVRVGAVGELPEASSLHVGSGRAALQADSVLRQTGQLQPPARRSDIQGSQRVQGAGFL